MTRAQRRRKPGLLFRSSLSALALSSAVVCAHAAQQPSAALALKKLTLDELMNVEVTSVSRTAEGLQGAAAAVAVVTNEDIRRSGANSIPEALRLVPGLHVARVNASDWAVSARGFSSVSSEKLLVLSDTRSLYTPLFSGVFWDVQDYLLEDIERIEVIRGPGAALWGSNAVNGVINITTRNAYDTQGVYLEAGAGDEDEAILGARYGGMIGQSVAFRVYGRHMERDATLNREATTSDDWRLSRAGFRMDWRATDADEVTFQGGAYRGDAGAFAPSVVVIGREEPGGSLRTHLSGGNILGRWRRTFAEDSEAQLRIYYDRTHRNDPSYVDDLDTFDVDAQHRFAAGEFLGAAHEVTWGLNFRYTDNENVGKGVIRLEPPSSTDSVFSAFVQDQMALNDAVQLTLGSKLEHNDFSGFEVQPSVRASWSIDPARTLWASIARAARIPTRLERDIEVDASDPAGNPVVRLIGNEDFDSEELLAYELGYRWRPVEQVLVDLAAFHNRYEGLASLELGSPFIDPGDGRTIIPVLNRNLNDGEAQGVEALVTYAPAPRWRLTFSYSYVDLEIDPGGDDLNRGEFLEGASPTHQFGLRSSLDLTEALQLDVLLRHLSDVRSMPDVVTGEGVDGYSELDVRIGWRLSEQLQLSVVGQNLLHDEHVEFGSPAARGAIERSLYGKLTWGF
jgi:iron complex outermembrane receptor protein